MEFSINTTDIIIIGTVVALIPIVFYVFWSNLVRVENLEITMAGMAEETEDVVIIRPEAVENIPEVPNDPLIYWLYDLFTPSTIIDKILNLNMMGYVELSLLIWLGTGLVSFLVDYNHYINNRKPIGNFAKWKEINIILLKLPYTFYNFVKSLFF